MCNEVLGQASGEKGEGVIVATNYTHYENYQKDKPFRELAEKMFEGGLIQAAKLGVDSLTPENLGVNHVFHRLVLTDLLERIVTLENKVKELENNTDGNRFTKGIDL